MYGLGFMGLGVQGLVFRGLGWFRVYGFGGFDTHTRSQAGTVWGFRV